MLRSRKLRSRVLPCSMLFGVPLAFVACGSDLTPRTAVTDLRILAIKADPPEVMPGESSSISALVADPTGEGRTLEWILVLCTPDAITGSCIEYDEKLETYPTEEEAQLEYAKCCARASEVAPSQPLFELSGTAFTTLETADGMLEGLDEQASIEGVNAQLNLLYCVAGVCTSGLDDPDASSSLDTLTSSLPPDESTLAIKRIRVSTASSGERNVNPQLDGVFVDGLKHDEDAPLEANPGVTYRLVPQLSAGSLQVYTDVYTDGTAASRVEEPYFSWYTTAGDFEEYYSEYSIDDGAMMWTAPSGSSQTDAEVIVVVWDRRGGIDWTRFQVHLE